MCVTFVTDPPSSAATACRVRPVGPPRPRISKAIRAMSDLRFSTSSGRGTVFVSLRAAPPSGSLLADVLDRKPVHEPAGDECGPLAVAVVDDGVEREHVAVVLLPHALDREVEPDLVIGCYRGHEAGALHPVVPAGAAGRVGPQDRVREVVEQAEQVEALDEAVRVERAPEGRLVL